MATKFEKAFEKMTPAERKRATEQLGDMMGIPAHVRKKKSTGKTTKKKTK